MISQLHDLLNALAMRVKGNRAVNVNSQKTKQAAIETGSFYFKKARAESIALFKDSKGLDAYDNNWQQLIRLAHGNNPKKRYESLIKSIIKTTKDLNVASHMVLSVAPVVATSKISYSDAEQILIRTLEELVPTAAASYKQGLADLNSKTLRFSYRGTASEFREALRETLGRFAPDKDVENESWYKPEKDQKRPTMKQKVRYILSSRNKNKTQRAAAESTVQLIETISGNIARAVYNRASLSTHVETTKEEVMQLKRYLDALFFDLLEIGQASD